jgi:hypothetical protein
MEADFICRNKNSEGEIENNFFNAWDSYRQLAKKRLKLEKRFLLPEEKRGCFSCLKEQLENAVSSKDSHNKLLKIEKQYRNFIEESCYLPLMPMHSLTPDVASQIASHSCLHPLQKDLIAAKIMLSKSQAGREEVERESNRKRDGVRQVDTACIALDSRFKSELNNPSSQKRAQKAYDQEKKVLTEAKKLALYTHQHFLYTTREKLVLGRREEATLEAQVLKLHKQLHEKIQKNIFYPKESRFEGESEQLQLSKFSPLLLGKYFKILPQLDGNIYTAFLKLKSLNLKNQLGVKSNKVELGDVEILSQLKSQSSNRHRVETQTSSESRDSEEELSKKRSSTINDSEQSLQSAKNWAALLVEARLSLLLPQDWNHRELLFSQLSNKERCQQSLLFIGPEESDLDQEEKPSEK